MKLVVKTVNGSALNVDVQENEKVEGKENMTIRKQVKQYVQVYSMHEKNERKRGKKNLRERKKRTQPTTACSRAQRGGDVLFRSHTWAPSCHLLAVLTYIHMSIYECACVPSVCTCVSVYFCACEYVQISEVKEKVEAVDASMRASSLILIHSGKILADDMTLETAGVKEGNFLVAMVSAKKATTANKAKEEKKAETPAPAAPSTAAAAAAPTSTSTEPAAAATPAGASVDPAATPSAPAKPEGGAEEGTVAGTGDAATTPSAAEAASNLVSGSKAEETVR